MDDLAWACHACTYLNSASRLSCSICSTVRSPLHDDVPSPLITNPLTRSSSSSSSSSSSNGFRRPGPVDEAPFFFSMCGVQRLVAGALSGALAGMFAVVGAFTGAVTGAVAGRATDSGLLRGAGVGAIAGAVISVGVLEASWAYWHSQPPNSGSLSSLVEFLEDFLNGRYAQDQVAPSTLAAHHWQVNISELNYDELYELFGPGEVGVKGLSDELLAKLPWQKVIEKTELDSSGEVAFCSICLQELLQGEIARSLPPCNHTFHMSCVDKWLMMHGSCPVCRQEIGKVWK